VILEGLVTTVNPDGSTNYAAMGPRIDPRSGFDRFLLRPFRTSTTFRNLVRHGEGVLHVTDDVLLIARAAVGPPPEPPTRPAERVRGRVIRDACRYYEFRITAVDDREDRATLDAETVHYGRLRDPFGFNRAQHAVLELAIVATRVEFADLQGLGAELERCRSVVAKTGGPREAEAFRLLDAQVRAAALRRGVELPPDRASGDPPC